MKENFIDKKKKLLLSSIILLSIIVFIFAIISYVNYKVNKELKFIACSVSENGKYEVVFYQEGLTDFPFGPSSVKIELKEKTSNKTVATERSSISNDGKTLYENNWTVNWLEDRVEVTLHGEEQKDKTLILNF